MPYELRRLYETYHQAVGAPDGTSLDLSDLAKHFMEGMVGAGEILVPKTEQLRGLELIINEPSIGNDVKQLALEEYELAQTR